MIPLLVIWSDIVPQPETQHSWQKEMLLKKVWQMAINWANGIFHNNSENAIQTIYD
jgi:hypothetical protein